MRIYVILKKRYLIDMKSVNNNFLTSVDVKNAISNVIIVGNAYGIMSYIEPLAFQLAAHNIKPFWFLFSGQEKRGGVYSFSQGVEDINEVYNYVLSESVLPINFLTHCAGSLITFEFLKHYQCVKINKLIVYGLLYSMNRRRPIAERRLINAGVNYSLTEEEWLYNPTDAIRDINREVLFCHAKDKLNLDRATMKEMVNLQSINSNIKIKWFDDGYDDNNQNISKFIDTYVSYFKD